MGSTAPAYTIGGITRPALNFDATGHIILDPAAAQFAAAYGIKALYMGLPASTPYPPVAPSLSTPSDIDAAANSIVEGAAANTSVHLKVSATNNGGSAVTYSLVGDTSGGGFKINPTTGVVSVANPAKIDFETSAGHAYSVTVQASDGVMTSSQTFKIGVTDVAPLVPTDSDATANSVAEGAAVNTHVGITAHATDINGPAVKYSLSADSSGGGFKIDAVTGVVSVADPSKIDYESAPGHAYSITTKASDGTLTNSQTFTIAVTDVSLPTPVDKDLAANTVAEGAAAGTTVGVTASAVDPNGPTTTYSLIGDTSGGGFTINAATGVVTVADASKIDYESAAGHAYSVTVKADDGLATTTQAFTVAVSDVAPSTPSDSDAAPNTVVEGAANGSTVGVTAHSADVNGPAVTYALVGDTSGGGFTINAATGVVTVADSTKIDYESAPGHAYTVTAQASDGTLANSQTFTIAVTDVAPTAPVDSDTAHTDVVVEGAANGSTVGVTAHSTDVNGRALTYSLVGDTSGGGFTINAATGVVTVADHTKIDYESAPGHAYTVTAQASDGTLDEFAGLHHRAFRRRAVDARRQRCRRQYGRRRRCQRLDRRHHRVIRPTSTDRRSLIRWSATPRAAASPSMPPPASSPSPIRPRSTSKARGGSYTVVAQSSDGTLTNSQAFVIAVTDVAPSTPVDSDAAADCGRRRRGQRLDGRRHRLFDRRQRTGGDVLRWLATPRAAVSPSMPRPASSPSPIPPRSITRARRPRLHRHRAGERRHADEFAGLHHRGVGCCAVGARGQRYRSHRHGRRRCGQWLDGRRHRPFDRRQWGGSDVFAGRRHLGRRLHDQCHDRRRHRRRPHQDRLRECTGSRLYHHRAGQRRHADEFAGLHHRRIRRSAVDAHRQ